MTPDKAQSLANDISCVITTLQTIADDLLASYPGSDYVRNDGCETSAPPSKTKPITLEELRAIIAAKAEAGFRAEVKELLKKYGSGNLSSVPLESYAALRAEAEGL